MQCLLGCAGVSPAQHNYSLFWCVVLGSTVFRLCSVVFCYIYSVLALLFSPLCVSLSALFCMLVFSGRFLISFFFSSVSLFLNLLLKLSPNDLLQLFEQNISISWAFAVFLFVSLRLKLSTCAINYCFFFFFCSCLPCCCVGRILSSTSKLQPLAWSMWLTGLVSMGLWEDSKHVVYPACLTVLYEPTDVSRKL